MTTVGSVDYSNFASIDPAQLDPNGALGQTAVLNFLGKLQSDPNLLTRTNQRVEDKDIFLKAGSFERTKKMGDDDQTPGQVIWAAPPSSAYSQAAQKNASNVATPIDQSGKIHIVTEDGKKAMGLTPEQFTEWTDARLSSGDPKVASQTQKFLDANGISRGQDGKYSIKLQPQQAALQQAFGAKTMANPVSSGILGTLQNHSWLLPVAGFLTGGAGGLAAGCAGALALKSLSGNNALSPALLAAVSGGSTNAQGSSGLTSGLGMIGSIMGGSVGTEGYAFQMKRQLTTMAEDSRMNTLIADCNNPGIPIEDLIAMFMAQMADTYDQKLRDKMEETARAEKRENDRENEKNQADYQAGMVKGMGSALGGLASMFGPVGAMVGAGVSMLGQTAASGITQTANAKISMEDAAGGYTKSSTILMQEIQILMNKWKQVNELLSNLAKTIHDMAMTPIRNLR